MSTDAYQIFNENSLKSVLGLLNERLTVEAQPLIEEAEKKFQADIDKIKTKMRTKLGASLIGMIDHEIDICHRENRLVITLRREPEK